MDVLALEHNLFTKPGGNSLEWNVRIRSREYELGGSYSIKVFLGDVPEVQSDWTGSPNYVGSHSVYTFATSEEEGDGLEVEGFVSLQRALEKRSQLQPYEPKVVVPYLKENLHWRVVTVLSPYCGGYPAPCD